MTKRDKAHFRISSALLQLKSVFVWLCHSKVVVCSLCGLVSRSWTVKYAICGCHRGLFEVGRVVLFEALVVYHGLLLSVRRCMAVSFNLLNNVGWSGYFVLCSHRERTRIAETHSYKSFRRKHYANCLQFEVVADIIEYHILRDGLWIIMVRDQIGSVASVAVDDRRWINRSAPRRRVPLFKRFVLWLRSTLHAVRRK